MPGTDESAIVQLVGYLYRESQLRSFGPALIMKSAKIRGIAVRGTAYANNKQEDPLSHGATSRDDGSVRSNLRAENSRRCRNREDPYEALKLR